MPPFHLLRLPFLAIKEVLKSMKIAELIELSKALEKRKNLIKQCITTKLKLSITLYAEYGDVIIGSEKDRCLFYNGNKNGHLAQEKYRFFRGERDFKPAGYLIEVIKNCCTLTEIFDRPEIQTRIGRWAQLRDINDIIDWLNREQLQVSLLHIEGNGLSEEGITTALSQIKTIEKLYLDVSFFPNYRHQFKSSLKEVWIHGYSWKSVDEVLAFDYEKLNISGSKFTNADLDYLLNIWKSGGFSKLKHLVVDWCNIDNKTTINGMLPPIWDGRKLADNCKSIARHLVNIDGSIEIERNDGTKALLLVEIEIFPLFSLFIED